jgi:glycosyltransferase involved in cell wall biosynthesis
MIRKIASAQGCGYRGSAALSFPTGGGHQLQRLSRPRRKRAIAGMAKGANIESAAAGTPGNPGQPLPVSEIVLVDLPGVTPHYDHALASALGRKGAAVELLTGRPLHGSPPFGTAYRTAQLFGGGAGGLVGRTGKLARLPLEMARVGRHARNAQVVHYQWLGLEEATSRLLPAKRPRVFTAHDVVPREPRRWQVAAFRRIALAMDAVVVHSAHGAERLRGELGVPAERIRVIPAGAFDHLTRLRYEHPLADELKDVDVPVILFFGYLSPYKGVDVLLKAFTQVQGAELWVAGVPRVDLAELRALADRAPGRVRFFPRFMEDAELPALFRRADVVVLPYREIDQSGVLGIALAFGRPLVVTRVGGLPELADRHDAAVAVPPEDPEALAEALARVVGDPAERDRLAAAAARVGKSEYSWDNVARLHLALYRELTGRP